MASRYDRHNPKPKELNKFRSIGFFSCGNSKNCSSKYPPCYGKGLAMAFICENPLENDKTRVKAFWVSRNFYDFIFVNFPQINVNFPNF